jgi:CelD/BcsL family acetyltransferase involved in cellulose biosynthesis
MHLVPMGRSLDCRAQIEFEDVTVELQLPRSWAEYLYRLNGKQRHEVRRKLRRLEEAGDICFRVMGAKDDLNAATDTFLNLFGANRQDKADFMTDEMAGYFRILIEALANLDLMKLYFLEIDRRPAAGVMCFDYRNRRYLYNSGYDLNYSRLSVGLLSKVLSIGEGIEAGCRIYDFLRGDEGYKYRLGGQSVPVHKCLIKM